MVQVWRGKKNARQPQGSQSTTPVEKPRTRRRNTHSKRIKVGNRKTFASTTKLGDRTWLTAKTATKRRGGSKPQKTEKRSSTWSNHSRNVSTSRPARTTPDSTPPSSPKWSKSTNHTTTNAPTSPNGRKGKTTMTCRSKSLIQTINARGVRGDWPERGKAEGGHETPHTRSTSCRARARTFGVRTGKMSSPICTHL